MVTLRNSLRGAWYYQLIDQLPAYKRLTLASYMISFGTSAFQCQRKKTLFSDWRKVAAQTLTAQYVTLPYAAIGRETRVSSRA
jgi:hypothetical protein